MANIDYWIRHRCDVGAGSLRGMVMNISFELRGQKVDLKYIWPIGTEQITKEITKDINLLDPDIVQLMMRIVRPGDRVIDGGAAIGYFTVLLSKLVGPEGDVFAFEPDPNSLAFLRNNIEANAITNTMVVPFALWSEGGLIKPFYLAQYSHANSLVNAEKDVICEILVTTAALGPYLPVRLIKLDIEGAEGHVLRTLHSPAHAPFIICELNNVALPRFGDTSVGVRQLMHSKGYEMYLIPGDAAQRPTLVTPYQRVIVNRTDINVLFSTPEAVGELYG